MTADDRRGWIVVGALTAVLSIVGTAVAGVGVLIGPLGQAFVLDARAAGAIATAVVLGMQLSAPLVGWCIDRFGPRIVMSVGAAIVAGGYGLASVTDSYAVLLGSLVLSGCGMGAAGFFAGSVVAASWLPHRKGLAIGLMAGLSAAAATFLVPLNSLLIASAGWRASVQATAALVLLFVLPVILLIVRTAPAVARSGSAEARSVGEVTRVLRQPRYLLLAVVHVLAGSAVMGVFFFETVFLTTRGFSLQTASLLYAGSNLVSFAGMVFVGWAADRYSARTVLAICLLGSALSLYFLLLADITIGGIAAVGLFTLLWGLASNAASQLVPVLLAERFGVAQLGILFGGTNFAVGAVSAFAPIATGWLYDLSGGYGIPFGIAAALLLLCLLPLFALGANRSIPVAGCAEAAPHR